MVWIVLPIVFDLLNCKVPIEHFEKSHVCIPGIFPISSWLWNLKVTGIPVFRSWNDTMNSFTQAC